MTEHLVYLDNAAPTFPKAPGTLEGALEAYRRVGASPGRGNHDLAAQASELVDAARARVARFFGAPDPDRVMRARLMAAAYLSALRIALRSWLDRPSGPKLPDVLRDALTTMGQRFR